jgi:hypothetical protein
MKVSLWCVVWAREGVGTVQKQQQRECVGSSSSSSGFGGCSSSKSRSFRVAEAEVL